MKDLTYKGYKYRLDGGNPETGSQDHVHYEGHGTKGAINEDGTIRHGDQPNKTILKGIFKLFNLKLGPGLCLFLPEWYQDYLNYIMQTGHYSVPIDNFCIDRNNRSIYDDGA